ncbi:ABC transporter substrate-binding protein [Clostridium saccharobutylicum]|uniref:Arginine-binding extracellular protein ArtP n=1 Tax=Clostridium saccharobutylicum DSM 13864 TaxID=1345695 RepID=U5MXA1_CLOSA|nr:ABC transporter substrate-binding protein [Clostridium saccharobutylicum]AGX45225.1 arginine-binding extracellular protein ArtP [Clostridium saccharobutylicum DSM 13864]AQR92502.1 arginine-binding extracellular protein ArtP precursor [Clostridium saccharobutylicum]AQS02405.1 arginine-binding extracellular protein ArtP precursor [Clostridium saccharobutylicum]AQS12010.1 arginine-binding extracellular protein ArtP precursor [Clostridium saccharobutylicum]AQS16388.1 arginine-binding extracellu
MKSSIVKKLIAVVSVATIAIGMVGCGNTAKNETAKSSTSSLDAIKAKGKLVVGTSADYPPYEFHSSASGEDKIVGFDIDIAEQLAKDLGVKLEVKDMAFDGLLVALQSNKVDMVFAGMTPTEERKQNADFSDIYYTATHRFIVRSGDETKITSMDDLKGKKIGVQKGSIQEGIAKDNFDAADVKSLDKIPDLILDLKNNKVDAVLAELPVAEINVEKNSGIAIVKDLVVKDPDGGVAIAMKKDSPELKDAINNTIKNLGQDKINQMAKDANSLVE